MYCHYSAQGDFECIETFAPAVAPSPAVAPRNMPPKPQQLALPAGSYQSSCKTATCTYFKQPDNTATLNCDCNTGGGNYYYRSTLNNADSCKGGNADIKNVNGTLRCALGLPGSYQKSCIRPDKDQFCYYEYNYDNMAYDMTCDCSVGKDKPLVNVTLQNANKCVGPKKDIKFADNKLSCVDK